MQCSVGVSDPPGTITGVISSKERAPRFGPGRLVVDGTDDRLCRKATFAFRPSRRQERQLLALLRACCEVYNAGLQERRDAWVRSRTTVSVYDQFKQVTELRGVRDDVLAWGIRPVRGALRRLDEAFAGFYRRAKSGKQPGRFDTASWDEPASWSVSIRQRTLRIQGVGIIRLSKSAVRQLTRLVERDGIPVTLSVTRRRAGGTPSSPRWVWRGTIGFKNVKPAERSTPTQGQGSILGADRGVAVTMATSDGRHYSMPGWVRQARDRISALERLRSRRARHSRGWRYAGRQIAREHHKLAQKSDNWARETARMLVAQADVIALENLHLLSMTKSASGTLDSPGTNVAAKAGLNRAMRDASLGRLARWVCVKAEEAGRRAWLVDAVDTSRRCAVCGNIDSRSRPAREVFSCIACGHGDHSDTNAAVNVAVRGQACEAAWRAAGSPRLKRPTPRLRRRSGPA
jgi:putative transposase